MVQSMYQQSLILFVVYVQDLEVLLQAQAKVEKDPLGFMEALKNGVRKGTR